MATYLFKCRVCEENFEFHTRNVDMLHCGEQVRRVWAVGGIKFNGSGFYVNDKKGL